MSVASLLFSFHGRISLRQYWLASMINGAVLVLGGWVVILAMRVSLPHPSALETLPASEVLAGLAGLMAPLAVLICLTAFIQAAITTKRLHDRDKGLVWLVGMYALGAAPMIFLPLALLSVPLGLCLNFELAFRRGTPGPNRFGDHDPATTTGITLADSEIRGSGGLASAMQSIEAAAKEKGQAGNASSTRTAAVPQAPAKRSVSGGWPEQRAVFGRKSRA
jgi:uncharacterized membrane protein YhaH (DUF805 family)